MFKFQENDNIQWCKLGPRAMFGKFILDIAKIEKKLLVISADLGRSSGLDRFKKEFPKQYLSVGISEQNMIGVAAGLAREGFKVFVTSFAPFLSMRASEQVRMNLGYMKHNVNLVALGSGVGMGFLGNSHFGLEDLSIIRAIPNLKISAPADTAELGKILYDYTFKTVGPSYIRLTGVPGSVNVYEKNYKYRFGKNVTLSKGTDVLILSHGSILGQIKLSLNNLKKSKISAELVNIVSLKPIDESIIKLLSKYKKIITFEEHTTVGGLGSIIAEKILKYKINSQLYSFSLPDKFGPTAKYDHLLKYHGLDASGITKKIINLSKNR